MSERIEYLNSPLVASPPRRMRSLPCGAIDSAFCCMIMQGGVIESECDHKTKSEENKLFSSDRIVATTGIEPVFHA